MLFPWMGAVRPHGRPRTDTDPVSGADHWRGRPTLAPGAVKGAVFLPKPRRSRGIQGQAPAAAVRPGLRRRAIIFPEFLRLGATKARECRALQRLCGLDGGALLCAEGVEAATARSRRGGM